MLKVNPNSNVKAYVRSQNLVYVSYSSGVEFAGGSSSDAVVTANGIAANESTVSGNFPVQINFALAQNSKVSSLSSLVTKTSEAKFTVNGIGVAKFKVSGDNQYEPNNSQIKAEFLSDAVTTKAYNLISYNSSHWEYHHNLWVESFLPSSPYRIYADDENIPLALAWDTNSPYARFISSLCAVTRELERSATAITKRHLYSSGHWSPRTGETVSFLTSGNVIVTRQILHAEYFEFDQAILVLDSDLPETITPMKVIGNWKPVFQDVLSLFGIANETTAQGGWGPFALYISPRNKIHTSTLICNHNAINRDRDFILNGVNYGPPPTSNLYTLHPNSNTLRETPNTYQLTFPKFLANTFPGPFGGYSSKPVMLPLPDNTLALVFTFGSWETGSCAANWTAALNAMIAEASSQAGISGTYTVTECNLNQYTLT